MQKMVAQAIAVLTFTFWTWEVSEHYHHLTLPHLKTSVLLTQYFPRLHLSSGHIPPKTTNPTWVDRVLLTPAGTLVTSSSSNDLLPVLASPSAYGSSSTRPLTQDCPLLYLKMSSDSSDKYEVLEKIGKLHLLSPLPNHLGLPQAVMMISTHLC